MCSTKYEAIHVSWVSRTQEHSQNFGTGWAGGLGVGGWGLGGGGGVGQTKVEVAVSGKTIAGGLDAK